MNIILIDDEKAQLKLLEQRLITLTSHTILGAFTNPHQALIEISKQQPDIVFLDISMPEINGIDLAKEIKSAMPTIKIIFLTAYDSYAVEAFDIEADDYLLKPVHDDRLLKALKRVDSNDSSDHNDISHVKQHVCSFNNLHFRDYNFDLYDKPIKWRTSKSREVFAYLLHNRDNYVRKDILIDQIWPNEDIKQSYAQLYSAIYQIRKTLKQIDSDIMIESSDNSYKIVLHNTLHDVDLFEAGIQEMPFITKDNIVKHKALLSLYSGDYFAKEDFPWSLYDRQRLHLKYINHAKRVADFYIFSEDYINAIITYLKIQKNAPYQEDIYFNLMKVYQKINDRIAIKHQYEQLKLMLEKEFDEKPSQEITDWYNNVFNLKS